MLRILLSICALFAAPPLAGAELAPEMDQRRQRMLTRYDANGDQVVERDEFSGPAERFRRMDRNGDGKVDGSDWAALARQRGGADRPGRGGADNAPGVGDPAPDFALKVLAGDEEVQLSEAYADGPVVLVFGSYTCPPFRSALEGMEPVYQAYQDRVDFYFVYIKEAHPTDGWAIGRNEQQGIDVEQPKDYAARSAIATTCQGALNISMPILVDTLDDATATAYGAVPNRTYLVDRGGTILYRGPQGPKGTQPQAVTAALEAALRR